MPRRKQPRIPDAILDQLLAGADPKTAFDPNGLLDDLKKALVERALNAEMDHHLAREETGNSRNGYGRKTVVTDTGKLELEVPRDRQASFDPQLIAKYQRRFPGFDDKVISMYARGMSTREIVGHLRELYGIEVSPGHRQVGVKHHHGQQFCCCTSSQWIILLRRDGGSLPENYAGRPCFTLT